MKRIKELKGQIEELNANKKPLSEELDKLLEEKRMCDLQKMVGRCYKHRESYGGGSADSWWLYTKIIGVGDEWGLQVIEAQKTCQGGTEIKTNTTMDSTFDRGWVRILPSEFNRQFNRILEELKKGGGG